MPRPITLFTGPFADVPLDTLAGQIGDWGYQGVELCCWGDHLEVQRGLSDDGYSPARVALLARHDLQIPVIVNDKVGQAVSDPIDARHPPGVTPRLRLGRRRPGRRPPAGGRGDGRHLPARREARGRRR